MNYKGILCIALFIALISVFPVSATEGKNLPSEEQIKTLCESVTDKDNYVSNLFESAKEKGYVCDLWACESCKGEKLAISFYYPANNAKGYKSIYTSQPGEYKSYIPNVELKDSYTGEERTYSKNGPESSCADCNTDGKLTWKGISWVWCQGPRVDRSNAWVDDNGDLNLRMQKFDGKSRRQVDEFRKWAKKVNFVGQAQTVAGGLFRDGTFCGVPVGNADTLKLQPLLMAHTTILPDGVTHGQGSKVLLQPPIKEFVVNEGSTGEIKEQTYKASEVVYGALDEWDSIQLDIRERETCGLYGESLIDPIELSIRYLHIINQGYVEFVKKYGMGRYSYSFPILEKLLESNIIDFNVFQSEIETWMEDNKNLSQNEDLVGIVKAEAIDAKGSLDIMEFKKALETDIQLGFLQSDLSMGDSKGSTYAAGYVSENSRMVALENLQINLSNIVNDFINRRLVMQNKSEDSVEIIFDELSLPQMTAQEITEWVATGILTKEQALEWGGFPVVEQVGE